ncbi:hypothetical protein V2I01_40990 [Micromonospora sp. BRA006-A]|nr:hypothetical protein [Micromonospora sp. BRA006-A]
MAVILGLLGTFGTLAEGNLVGIVLSLVFIGGGVFLLSAPAPTAGRTPYRAPPADGARPRRSALRAGRVGAPA